MFRHSRSKALAYASIIAISHLLTAADISSADLGDCSQPVSEGVSPSVVDCMYILEAAAGLVSCSPECICDPTQDAAITGADALQCLLRVVDIPVTILCCGATTSTTTTTLGECALYGEACGDGLPCCHYSCRASGVCCKLSGSCSEDSDCCGGSCSHPPGGGEGSCNRVSP